MIELRHATSVSLLGGAVLIEGPSGSGKSDVALRLIDRGARLICDDYTQIARDGATLLASPAPNIAGKIEIFGLGIQSIDHIEQAEVKLVITLGEDVARFPEVGQTITMLGINIPLYHLSAFHISTPIKIERIMAGLMAL